MVTLWHPPSLHDLFKGLRSERLEPRSVLIESVLGAWLEHVMWCYKLHKKSAELWCWKLKMAFSFLGLWDPKPSNWERIAKPTACWVLWFDCLAWDYQLALGKHLEENWPLTLSMLIWLKTKFLSSDSTGGHIIKYITSPNIDFLLVKNPSKMGPNKTDDVVWPVDLFLRWPDKTS